MELKSMAVLTAALMASGLGPVDDFLKIKPEREPKNKYNLTPEQIEEMKSMTPKEKKRFLKGIGNGT